MQIISVPFPGIRETLSHSIPLLLTIRKKIFVGFRFRPVSLKSDLRNFDPDSSEAARALKTLKLEGG